jgi:hypothetical protein
LRRDQAPAPKPVEIEAQHRRKIEEVLCEMLLQAAVKAKESDR